MKRIRLLMVLILVLIPYTCRLTAQSANPAEAFSHEIDPARRNTPDSLNFVRREEMIPMRDGVKLYTIILIPSREAKMPILLTRTPYGARVRSTQEQRSRLEDVLVGGEDIFAGSGYIRVFQDVRGRNRSEGDYVVTLPLRGPLNPTPVDHSTDAYDTIEWLIENIDEDNGRVGMIGTSYDGLLVLMGLVDPHPALKAAVPLNPMVDGWKGDDWFHNGAFRQMTLDFLKLHLASSGNNNTDREKMGDDYDFFLDSVSSEKAAERIGIAQLDFWNKLVRHPNYDIFWKSQAMDRILSEQPLKVPTMYVHSLWDPEDIYGPIAAYLATEDKDEDNDSNFLVIGPWNHGGSSGNSMSLGPVVFGTSTGYWFRHNILLPFLNARLKDEATETETPPVLVYETGSNTWQSYDSWPLSCESGCRYPMMPLYLKPGFGLDFAAPEPEAGLYDTYVSDPQNPVPYRHRPIKPVYSQASTWSLWLVDNQKSYESRSDVLTYRTEVLQDSVKISGLPIADLFASTSGTDVDYIVKIIDEYPDSGEVQAGMSGYQLMISADIFRGRYRKDPEHPLPVSPGQIERFRWTLPAATHVFLQGHRIVVQIQSSWFPLYDRNPQTFVENIFLTEPRNFRKAVEKIYRSGEYASSILLPVVK
ncbi:MAG: CocE/NonD family hydrolase [Acidobacteriota bacterium]